MEFGRVADIARVDLALPKDHPGTAAVLAKGRGGGRARLYVGGPIWNDATLARKLQSEDAPSSDKLALYAHAFNSVELNASGYGLSADNAAKWAATVPPGFLFCPKVPRDVSHGGSLDTADAAFDRFAGSARAFGEHLGPAFLQFPDSFGPNHFPQLERFLRAQAGKLALAVELRHKDWFNEARRSEPLYALLEELKLSLVITDVPGRRDLMHQRLTAPTVFVRYSGHDLGDRDLRRLDDWADRFKAWLDAGLESAFFFVHHEPKHFSAEWGARFLEALNAKAGTSLRVPKLGAATAKGKKKAPGPETQGSLFS